MNPANEAEKRRAYMRAYRERNREKQREYMRAYRRANPEKWADYREQNRDKIAAAARDYRATNAGEINAKAVVRRRVKRASDPVFAMAHRARARIAHAYRGALKPAKTQALIGCTFEEFAAHIEAQFAPGMSWSNRGEWHIDHIVPICSFDLSDAEQAARAFHFTNCRPLWASDNLAKGARL